MFGRWSRRSGQPPPEQDPVPESPQAENYIVDALPPEQLQLMSVTDYPDIICRAEFSPDGRYLAAMAGAAPHVLDVGTGKIIWKHLATEEERDTDLSWAPDSRRIAVSTKAGPGVFDGITGRMIWRNDPPPDGHYEPIAWSPAGDLIAVGGPSGSVILLDAANGSVVRTLSHHRGSVTELAWSPDGQFLASGGGASGGKEFDRGIRIWDKKTGSVTATLEGHTGYIADLAWSPRSAMLISVSSDNTIRVWDPLNGRLTHTIEVHTRETRGIAFSPDGQIFASSSWDDTMRFWRTADLRQLGTVRFNYNGIQVYDRVAFSPDGRTLCATRAKAIFLFRVNVPALAAGSRPRSRAVHDGQAGARRRLRRREDRAGLAAVPSRVQGACVHPRPAVLGGRDAGDDTAGRHRVRSRALGPGRAACLPAGARDLPGEGGRRAARV